MDETGEGMLKKAQEMLLNAKNSSRRETETPMTQALSPEAREDALKVAEEIRAEANKLLRDQEKVVRVDPNKIKGNLIISGKALTDKTIFQGADLGMSRYTFDYHPETQSQDITQELWHFYPDHVLKTVRHSSETYSGQQLKPKGLATEKTEADRDDLQTLLGDIKTSAPFVPQTYK